MARPSTIDKHPQKEEIIEKLRGNNESIEKLSELYGISQQALYRQRAKLEKWDIQQTAKQMKPEGVQEMRDTFNRNTFGENIAEDLEMIRKDLIAIKDRTIEEKPETAIKAIDKLLGYMKTVIEIFAERREQEQAHKEGAYEKLRAVVKKIADRHPEIDEEIRRELEAIDE